MACGGLLGGMVLLLGGTSVLAHHAGEVPGEEMVSPLPKDGPLPPDPISEMSARDPRLSLDAALLTVQPAGDVPLAVLSLLAGAAGMLVAGFIHRKKATRGVIKCPLHSDCAAVIHSEYSKFLRIPVEVLGFMYYAFITAAYALILARPALGTPSALVILQALSGAAFLFSAYLLVIQLAVLRQWCTWCLLSAGLSTIIVLSAFGGRFAMLVPILAEQHLLVLLVHVLSVSLGIGAATVADVLFFRFLRDFRMTEWEAGVLRAIGQVVWAALAVIVLSGAALYLPQSASLNANGVFLGKMVGVAVLVLNGIFLNLLVSPRLIHLSLDDAHAHRPGELRRLRKLAFGLGAVSVVSWYFVFTLGMLLRGWRGSLASVLLTYVLALAGAIVLSQLAERLYERRGTGR